MTDQRKTKAQLIAELSELRSQIEQQNRELTIQNALERVRARALGMQESTELSDVSAALFEAVREMIPSLTESYIVFDDGNGATSFYGSTRENPHVHQPDATPWSGDETRQQRAAGASHFIFPWGDTGHVGHRVFHQHGWISYAAEAQLPADDIDFLERLTAVFDVAYRRFEELQQKEQRAREAQLEAATARIRAEAMAMRGSAGLMDVVGVMHQSLHELGVEPFTTSIHFVDEDEELFQHYLAIRDLEPHGFVLSADEESELQAPTKVVEGGWRVRWTHSTENERRLAVWRDGRITTGVMSIEPEDYPGGGGTWHIPDPEQADWSVLPRGEADYTQVPFQYGIVTFTVRSVSEDHIATVQALVEALSLGYMRFQDFQQLEQASVNKSQFLRRMSHDLRSPMNAILGYTRLLRRRLSDRLDDREARNLRNIETSSGNLLDLINDILDLSRIEAGRIEVQPRDFDPCQLANECADALESIVKKDVTLIRDLAAVGQINSDPDRLRQVVMNLLGNATKFTEAGSITLSLQKNNDGIELSVADTGIGIPADDLPHIFDEFRQVERQGGESAEGTGLGLAIARKTIELLGGEISATSEVGAGTTFTVRLPA